MRSLILCVTASVLLLAGIPGARAAAPDDVRVPGHCRAPYSTALEWGFDVSRVASARVVVLDGKRVRLDRKGWAADDRRDPSWTLAFHSLAWLVPLALDDAPTAIKVFLERDKALPDPGAAYGNSYRRPLGWTPGQFRSRLDTATCLYVLTGDKRLLPIAQRLAVAVMDPLRYPGPPYYPVHNHGAMANVSLMQAGKVFGKREWIRYAQKRFARDMPLVFEPCGMMREQSSTYQLHNLRLWSKTADSLGVDLTREQRALDALVRPDGVLEAIGDGQPTMGLAPNGASLWCRETGWAAGTIAPDSHFTLRFGPRVDYHGHQDHGGLTWFALGTPVLSDRGLHSKSRGERYDYAHSMSAHSVFEPVGRPGYDPATGARRLSAREFAVWDAADGIERRRDVLVGPTRLVVRDRGTGAKEWIQHWQLAPGWRPTASGAVNPDAGLELSIDCPRLKAVRVQAFTAWRVTVDAWDMQCRVTEDRREGARQVTSLTVRAMT